MTVSRGSGTATQVRSAAVLADGRGRGDGGAPHRSTTRAAGARAGDAAVAGAVVRSDLGTGVKTKRRFCDVVIASTARESVSVTIPPACRRRRPDVRSAQPLHRAAGRTPMPVQAFTSHTAVVAVDQADGRGDRAGGREPRVPDDRGSVRSDRRLQPEAARPRSSRRARLRRCASKSRRRHRGRHRRHAARRVARDRPRRVRQSEQADRDGEQPAHRVHVRGADRRHASHDRSFDVVIIGAGPAGLAAAIAAQTARPALRRPREGRARQFAAALSRTRWCFSRRRS